MPTFVIEAVNAIDGGALVVAPQDEEVLRILDLEGKLLRTSTALEHERPNLPRVCSSLKKQQGKDHSHMRTFWRTSFR